jgi:archaellum component FlaC
MANAGVRGLDGDVLFIQCADCGAVVGAIVAELKREVDAIKSEIEDLASKVETLGLDVNGIEADLEEWTTETGSVLLKIAEKVGA